MPRPAHRSLPYRPAIDGLRAVAVSAVVLFHLGAPWMRGGWLGVDLFFVLSGFLITSLLLSEHRRWGSIDLIGFWQARARRLLPALVLMLLAVLALSAIFAVPAQRRSIASDVLAAFFYVANWRFMLGHEQYFDQIALPSPVRHTWSLSIEEQYYLFFPLLLGALLYVVRRRRTLAAALLALAAVSAVWMAILYVPGVDPSRVYYGTDTRAFELLIGAAAAALLGRHEFEGDRAGHTDRTDRVDIVAGGSAWAALVALVAACVLVDERNWFVFRGGLVIFALLALVPIVAAASGRQSSFARALALEPIRQLGLLSYSLYLWHWPVIVFLPASRTGLPFAVNAVVQLLLSVALAWLSLHYVEQPIRRHGLAAVVRHRGRSLGRVAGAFAAVAVVAGAFWLPTVTGANASGAADNGRSIALHIAPYFPEPTSHRVAVVGNSVPRSMVAAFPNDLLSDLQLNDVTAIGCDPFSGTDAAQAPPPQVCLTFRSQWAGRISDGGHPDLVLLYVPQTLLSDRNVNGHRLRFGSNAFDTWLAEDLDRLRSAATAVGARFALVNLACHRLPDFGTDREVTAMNDDGRVRQLNTLVRSWAGQASVPVIDQYSALCTGGYHDSVNGTPLYKDGLHVTQDSGRILWEWLAPQLQTILTAR